MVAQKNFDIFFNQEKEKQVFYFILKLFKFKVMSVLFKKEENEI